MVGTRAALHAQDPNNGGRDHDLAPDIVGGRQRLLELLDDVRRHWRNARRRLGDNGGDGERENGGKQRKAANDFFMALP
jgi:hypothetical protein